jgi:hypothetical protein
MYQTKNDLLKPRHSALVAVVTWSAIAVACSTVHGQS